MNQRISASTTEPRWWNSHIALALYVLLAAVPLLWPPVPPLVDLPGHMGRYAVQLDPASPILSQWYAFRWQLIGNAGVDLLIVPLSQVFGLELGVKLIVLAIPVLTVVGLLWIATEIHGRVPPTTLFALPLAYGHPFVFGFVNFSLGMALALLGFALWLRITRRPGGAVARSILFALIACTVWLAHTFAWGVLGLLCGSAEFVRRREAGESVAEAALRTVVACLPMALPLLPMLFWRSQVASQTDDWFNIVAKLHYLMRTFRDRWQLVDLASLAIVFGVILVAIRHPQLRYARRLALATALLVAAFVLLPRIIFGSAYADMRLLPFIFAIALVAIGPVGASRRTLGILAAIGVTFFVARTAATAASFATVSARWEAALGALDHVPRGSRLVSFTRWPCGRPWTSDRLEHVPALAIVRRHAFSNDQWQVAGANAMTVIKRDAPGFTVDPSQMVTLEPCPISEWRTLDASLRQLPRGAFDQVWLIGFGTPAPELTRGMTLVWARGDDRLYRIDR